MRRLCALVLSVALSATFAAESAAQDFKGAPSRSVTIAPVQKQLPEGEALDYVVEWLGIPVGHIFLRVQGIVQYRGRRCYHLTARSFPNRLFRKIYDLEYRVSSYVDAKTFESLRFLKIRRINKHFNYVLIEFDPARHRARYRAWGTSQLANLGGTKAVFAAQPSRDIAENTQDLLSSFYYYRLIPIAARGKYPVNVYYSEANWSMILNVAEPFVREMRGLGQFPAVNVVLTSTLNDFILGKRGLRVCLTADERRVPLEFVIGSAVGALRGVLKQYPK